MSLRRRALFLAGLFVAVSCSDAGNPLEPGPTPRPEPKDVLQALDCSVSVRGDNFSCAPTKPSTGGALGSGFTFVGGQDKYVHLEKVAAQNIAPDTLQIDVTIKNLIPQALGTTDGETEDPYGVRVFFMEDPVTNPGGLMASVGNEDGTDFFTTVNQSYFEYDTIIKPDSVTEPRSWKLKYDPSVGPTGTIFFRVLLRAQVKYEAGWVDVTPDEDTIAPGATVQLTAITRNKLGDTTGVSQNVSWSSSDTAIATVDANGLVTGDSAGVVYIKATPPGVQAPDSARIVVNSAVQAVTDSVDAFGNVTITYPASIGLLANDTDADGPSQTLSVLPDTVPTAEGGTARISANGSFTYLSFPGFTGKDTIPYAVTDGVVTDSGVAIVNVGQRYWYVQPGAAGSGDGTDAAPFNTLAAADAASAGTEPILVRGGGGVPAAGGGIVLNTGQPLLGQGIAADLTATLMGGVVSVTLLDGTGVSPVIRASSGATVTLGQNNTVRGVNIEAASGAAITGSNFGTLTADEMLLLNPTGGPALNLSNGTLNNVTVLSLSSTGSSTTGLSLTNVGGTLAVNGGTIAGSAGTAMNVAGDSAVVINYAGNIQQSSSGMALLSVSGNHTGTLTFNVGALTASGGTGLQFSGAKGTYNFNGTTTLAGGDAGIDIVGSSDGTFAFSADARIENPTGTAFRVNGSSPDVTYNGTILRTANAALLVDLTSVGAGSAITFSPAAGTDSLHASVGGGIQLSAAVGTVGFSGTTTLTGAAPGVDLLAGSNGTVSFGALTSIIGNGLLVSDSEPVLTYAGTISTTTGRPVEVNGASPCGTVTVSGSITSNGGGSGILVQDCSAGTISLTGAKTLATGANPGVTLSNNNSAAAINLTGGALSITTSAAAGILGNGAAGFGTLTVSNATVSATGGPALDLTNGTLTGTFTSLSSTNSTGTGVTLSSVNGTLNASAGSISGAAGTAFNVSGGNLAGTLAVGITQNNNAPTLVVAGGHNTGTLTFSGDVSAGNGNGVQFTDADGTYTFTGDFTLNGAGDEGIDIAAASTGTVNVTPSGGNAAAITSPSGIAIAITGGSADLNYSGNVTQASNQPLLSVSGVHTGDVTFPSGTLNASNGNGLQFDNADGTYDFDGTVMLSGGDAGIDITNNSTGTFTFPATATITSPSTGNLVSILNSAPNFTYLGAFTKANNNVTGILVQSNTGGTINFTGSGVTKNIQSGNAAGVSLVNNTGTAINFGGGSLVIQSGSGAGFNATGGGTINVTGAGNTISSGTGTALNVQNTTIGASGLSFVSISANGGTHGINLSNTGNTNGLQVTGTGSAGSGGTIQNTQTGAAFASARNINLSWMNFTNANTSDGAGTCDGLDNSGCTGVVKLTSVTTVALDRLGFSGTIAQEGIVGSTVNGIAISNMSISNAGNEQWEHGIKLFDVLGTANSITATTVTNAGNFNIFVQNSTSTNGVAGASDSLRIAGNTISNPGSALQSDGITVATRATGNLKVVVDANTFNTVRAATDGVQVDAGGSSKAVAVVTGNSIVGYNTAVNISGASNATNLFTVQNNPTLSSVAGATVNLASNGLSILRGTVKGNTNMTTASTNNSTTGIDAIVDAGGVIVADIDGNTITGKYLAGIRGGSRNAFNPGDADFTIRNNTITAQIGTTTPFAGLYMVAGNGSPGETNRTCMNLSNNQIVNQAPNAFDYDIYLENYNGSGYTNTFQIQGLTGSGSNATNVRNYVSSLDIGGARVEAFTTTGTETYTAATCATP